MSAKIGTKRSYVAIVQGTMICAIAATLAIALMISRPSLPAYVLVLCLIAMPFASFIVARRRQVILQGWIEARDRWNNTMFERAGISVWREDWSAVREIVLALLRSGVRDMEAHFAAHPDELRELRGRVMIKDVNAFTVSMMGAESKDDFLGSLDKILTDTDTTFIQWLVAFARGDSFYRSEAHIVRPDGTEIDVLFTGALPSDMRGFEDILVSCLDITEYKVAQERLASVELEIARASRITTMGALTASIAHEVNSPLAAIVSNAEAGLRWLTNDPPDLGETQTALANVISDATRAHSVVARTRSFLGNSPRHIEPHNLVDTARSAIILIERELRTLGTSVNFDAPDDLPQVMADSIQIQQVLINLALNAAQAMANQVGPRDLVIALRRDEAMMRVDVQDHGIGIGEGQIDAIFEPFYSTKVNGIGMGLAVCRNCVTAHGGRLWVTSALGSGSTFHFTLPVAV